MGLAASNITVTHSGSGTDDNRLTIEITNIQYKTLAPYFAGTYTGPSVRVSFPMGIFN
jgi:hypothetical protein